MNQLKEDLMAGRRVITNLEHWTQRASARRASELPTMPEDQYAVCWCSVGAVEKALGGGPTAPEKFDRYRTMLQVILKAAITLYGHQPNVAGFNDTHTHAQVLAAWDLAIKDAAWDLAIKDAE